MKLPRRKELTARGQIEQVKVGWAEHSLHALAQHEHALAGFLDLALAGREGALQGVRGLHALPCPWRSCYPKFPCPCLRWQTHFRARTWNREQHAHPAATEGIQQQKRDQGTLRVSPMSSPHCVAKIIRFMGCRRWRLTHSERDSMSKEHTAVGSGQLRADDPVENRGEGQHSGARGHGEERSRLGEAKWLEPK